jgi:hypothetical protein
MIRNHTQFTAAIQDRKKVCVRFYSTPDSGVLDRVCAPMDYGPGGDAKDGLNRYWLWDYASDTGSQTLGLLPQQIMDLQVLGEVFNPSEFIVGPPATPVVPLCGLPPVPVVSAGGGGSAKLLMAPKS